MATFRFTRTVDIVPFDGTMTNSFMNVFVANAMNDVNIGVNGLSSTFMADIDIAVANLATDNAVTLMSDVGGSLDLTGNNLIFDDQATNLLPTLTAIPNGTYRPADVLSGTPETSSYFFSPNGVGSSAPTLTSPGEAGMAGVLNNNLLSSNPGASTWVLAVGDDAPFTPPDPGDYTSWSLEFTTGDSDALIVMGGFESELTITHTGSGAGTMVLVDGEDTQNVEFTGVDEITIGSTSGLHVVHGSSLNETIQSDGLDGDIYDGGAGIDTLDYRFASLNSSTYWNLGAGVAVSVAGQGFNTETFVNFENLILGASTDQVYGSAAANRIEAGESSDTVEGLGGNDTLLGEEGADFLYGGGGNDSLLGGEDEDSLFGGLNDDILNGGNTDGVADGLYGGAGNDTLIGDSSGSLGETLNGDAGNDTFLNLDTAASVSANFIYGGEGDDSAVFQTSTALEINLGETGSVGSLNSGVSMVFYSIENVTGGSGNDLINGSNADETLSGGIGADSLFGGSGDDDFGIITAATGFDSLNGGFGYDEVSFVGHTGALTINFVTDLYTVAPGLDFAMTDVEQVTGGNGNDTMLGSGDVDNMAGGLGNDSLMGEGGGDIFLLAPGDGNDIINGGSGNDIVAFGEDVTTSVQFDILNLLYQSGDTFTSIEGIVGSAANDTLAGGNIAELIVGGSGNDILIGRGGADSMQGGGEGLGGAGDTGFDMASYETSATGVALIWA